MQRTKLSSNIIFEPFIVNVRTILKFEYFKFFKNSHFILCFIVFKLWLVVIIINEKLL